MRFLIISSRVFLVFSAETFSIWLFHKLLASLILLGNEEWSKILSGTLPPARSFNWAVSQFVTGYILLWLQWFCCIEIVATESWKEGRITQWVTTNDLLDEHFRPSCLSFQHRTLKCSLSGSEWNSQRCQISSENGFALFWVESS